MHCNQVYFVARMFAVQRLIRSGARIETAPLEINKRQQNAQSLPHSATLRRESTASTPAHSPVSYIQRIGGDALRDAKMRLLTWNVVSSTLYHSLRLDADPEMVQNAIVSVLNYNPSVSTILPSFPRVGHSARWGSFEPLGAIPSDTQGRNVNSKLIRWTCQIQSRQNI